MELNQQFFCQMNINKFLILGFLVLTFVKGFCQKTYSLEECISTALHNSQLVRSTDIRLKDAGIDVDRATAFKLPSASAGFGHGLNFGRSIDPSTNDFINERITRGGFSAQAFQLLWQAGSTKQSIKQYQYAEEASRWTLKNNNQVCAGVYCSQRQQRTGKASEQVKVKVIGSVKTIAIKKK